MPGDRKHQRWIRRAPAAVLIWVLAAACTSTTGGEPTANAPTAAATAVTTGSVEQAGPTGPTGPTSGAAGPSTGPAGASSGVAGSAGASASGTAAAGSVTAWMRFADNGNPPSPNQLAAAAFVMTQRIADIPGASASPYEPDMVMITAPGDDPSLLEPVAVQGELLARPVIASGPAGDGTYSEPTPAGTDAATLEKWTTTTAAAVQSGEVSCEGLPPAEPVDPESPALACDGQQELVYLLQPSLFAEGFVDRAAATPDPNTGGWTITVTLGAAATDTWSTYTAEHIGEQVAIAVDGTVVSAPAINSAITASETAISGAFTADEAKALAAALNSGSLGLDVIDVEVTTG